MNEDKEKNVFNDLDKAIDEISEILGNATEAMEKLQKIRSSVLKGCCSGGPDIPTCGDNLRGA